MESARGMSVVNLQDAALERQLERVMERIKEAQDAETRRVLWGEFKSLHAQRSEPRVRAMEEARGLSGR